MADTRPVVVGTDGSPASSRALDWASDAAAAHGRPLVVVHAAPDAQGAVVTTDGDDALPDPVVDTAVASARDRQQTTQVSGAQYPDPPVQSLLAAAGDAAFLVLGSRGYDGFRGLLVGSTALHVVPLAPCPVVVVHPDDGGGIGVARHPGQVVLGYDGSAQADAAAVFAFEHARATGAGVVAVAVTSAIGVEPAVEDVDVPAAPLGSAEASYWAPVRLVSAGFPEVPVRYRNAVGRPAATMIAESNGSALAVVGVRGVGGFRELLMGSVSQQLMAHADCPVAVVRALDEP